MFNKPFKEIGLPDLEALVHQRVAPENQHLEYKRELDGSDKSKRTLLEEVAGFANTDGGYLIYGVEEHDGKPTTICGTVSKIGNQPIEDWINDVLISDFDERVRYEITPPMSLQDGRVVLVLHIPESLRKPHMITYEGRNRYYTRHNRTTLPARHSEVRDMFGASRKSRDAVEEFMKSRHIFDENDPQFAQNENTERLIDRSMGCDKQPFLLHSVIPLFLDDERIHTASKEFDEWMGMHERGFQPDAHTQIFKSHTKQVHLHGALYPEVLPRSSQEDEEVYYDYIEVLNNGYIESGLSSEVFWNSANNSLDDQRKTHPVMNLGFTTGYTWLLLGFATAFFRNYNYLDEIIFQVNIANVRGFALGGFGKKNDSHKWAEPYSWHFENPSCCRRQDNIKIAERFIVSEMSDQQMKETAHKIAAKISLAFGEEVVKCFDDNGVFNYEHMRRR